MHTKMKLALTPIALAMTVNIPLVGSVFAQETTSFELEEIVVTARKVEESLQDVSLSITAFGAEDITRRSIEELEDVALLTPGLSFEDFSNGGFATPIIRGAAQFSVDALEQNVSTFIDGIYIPRNYAIDLGKIDLAGIEVVKGPQSALYGANAFLGAITYTTAIADLDELNGGIGLEGGSDGRQDISGKISVPILPGVLAAKASFSTSEFDGDWDNAHPAASSGPSLGTDETIGGWDKDTLSVSIVAQPTDAVNVEFGYHLFETFTESRAQYRMEIPDLNCGGVQFGSIRGFCGELPGAPTDVVTGETVGLLIDPRGYGLDSETELTRLAVSADLTDKISMSYVFGNIDGEVFSAGNSDRSPISDTATFNGFTVLPVGGFDYDSQELRFEFNADSGLYAMLGAFYSDGTDIAGGAAGYFAPVYTDSLDPITQETLDNNPDNIANPVRVKTETERKAIFGRVALPLMDDKLVVSAEGRYTEESKVENIVYNDGTASEPLDDSYFVPRLSLDYFVSDEQLLYLSYAEGIKSGGTNPEISQTTGSLEIDERTFEAETNDTFEIGSKNTLLDGRLQLNGAIYYTAWEDLQITEAAENGGFFTTSITGNLGAATLKGAEFDLTYAANDSLVLNAGLAINDATYDSGIISQRIDRANVCDDIVCNANGDVGGNSLPRTSDTQWNIGAEYNNSFGNSGVDYFLRTDVVGQSEQFVSEANIATIPSRTLVNLRGGLSKDNWSAELWVTNLTDREYVSNAFYIPSAFFIAIVPTLGNKRRMGVSLTYDF